MKFPNTADVPSLAILDLKHRDDFNHDSIYANYFDNSLTRFVKQIKFSNADLLNLAYRDGVNVIDFNEDIDKEEMYKTQRRFMLGRENVNMSDMYPAYQILNGASSELYNNEGESRKDFFKLTTERHIAPIVLELDPSHGKYTADQKPVKMPNTAIEMNFTFRTGLPSTCVLMLTSGYVGKYVQKRGTNGIINMEYQSVDIQSNLL